MRLIRTGIDRLCLRASVRTARVVVSLAAAIVFVAGCGGSEAPKVPRENVAGSVKFDGAPLPFGYIDFRNDESKVVSTIEINDGQFSSSKGEGPAEGKNKVYVAGFKEKDGMPLWAGSFSAEFEVKKGDNSGADFSIEKKAVKPYNPKKWNENEHDRS